MCFISIYNYNCIKIIQTSNAVNCGDIINFKFKQQFKQQFKFKQLKINKYIIGFKYHVMIQFVFQSVDCGHQKQSPHSLEHFKCVLKMCVEAYH